MRKSEQAHAFWGWPAMRDMAPTPAQLDAIRQTIRRTTLGFCRLSSECVEDLVQEVLLRLWKYRAEDKLLTCPAYVRQVAANTTIDALRMRGAKKRSSRRVIHLYSEDIHAHHSRTPEEILLAREEAVQLIRSNHALRRRVEREIRRQHVKRPQNCKRARESHERRKRSRGVQVVPRS